MNYSFEDEREIDEKTIYPNNYEYSDMRKRLNKGFYNKSFTEDLETYINTTEVDNSVQDKNDVARIKQLQDYDQVLGGQPYQ